MNPEQKLVQKKRKKVFVRAEARRRFQGGRNAPPPSGLTAVSRVPAALETTETSKES